MASIRRYDTAKGIKWRVQYRTPDGKSRTKTGFRTKSEAERWVATHTTSIINGTWVDPNAGNITIESLGARWMETRTHLKPSTARVEALDYRNHVLPYWGHRRIKTIKPSEVQAWVSASAQSPSTTRHHHAILSKILDMAVLDNLIPANPAKSVTLPRKNQPTKVYLTISQLQRLADEATVRGELIWLLGTTGLRWGEAAGLQVQDLDPLNGRIRVARNAVTVGGEVVVGTPKNHERRTVACPGHVMGMLEDVARGKPRAGWLWESPAGGPMRLPGKGSFFHSALGRVRAADPSFPSLTIHGLRHVAAGLLVSAGANVKVVQKQLGHKSAAMTLDVYAELFDDDLDAVRGALDALVGSLGNVVKLSSNRGFGDAV